MDFPPSPENSVIKLVLRCMGTPLCVAPVFTRGNDFCDFLFVFLADIALQNWVTHKGKNLLQEEQILSLKSSPFRG